MKTNKAKAKVAVKSAKNVKKTVKATADAVAQVVIQNDVKANHSMRVSAASRGIDLFATHSELTTSRGYVQQLMQALTNKSALHAELSKGEVALLVVNGVLNIVRTGKGGFYGRNGKVAVRDFNESQMLVGNVDSLKTLYGARVALFTESEARKLYDAKKETVTRSVGSGKAKQTITGRVIAQGQKGDMSLSVVAVDAGGKLTFHNCEDKNNTHNALHRFTQEKATASK